MRAAGLLGVAPVGNARRPWAEGGAARGRHHLGDHPRQTEASRVVR
ncbi:hypothetical protein ACWED2_41810 [Amycolatopsis sp. NPDC005003]